MFGLFKKESKSNINSWIKTVDEAYNDAFETHDMSTLSKYVTRELAAELFQSIRSNQKVYSGLSKYRNVNWKKESEDTSRLTMLKIVTYDHIKVTRGIIANVGDDFTERWIILKHDNGMTLSSIRRV